MAEDPTAPELDTSALDPEVLLKIREGEYAVAGPGQLEGKPVVIDAKTGRWVTGSGRPANANDPALVGKVHGYKHGKKYAEVLEQLIPAMKDGSENAILSLEELITAAKSVIIAVETKLDMACPACEHKFTVSAPVGKPDVKMLTFLIERLAGAAQKTQEINLHSEEIVKIMEDKRVLHQIEVISLSPEERANRRRQVLETV